MTLTHYTSSQS